MLVTISDTSETMDQPDTPVHISSTESSSGSKSKLPKLTCFYYVKFSLESLIIAVSMLLYVIDSVLDFYMALRYCQEGHVLYFSLTIFFVLVPGIAIVAFSILLYKVDAEVLKSEKENTSYSTRNPLQWYVICTICSPLQFGPIWRDAETLSYKVKLMQFVRTGNEAAQSCDDAVLKKCEDAYEENSVKMAPAESHAAFLRLFERFMEAAPQATLQLFVFIYHFDDPKMEITALMFGITITFSLLSLANSLLALNRTSHNAQKKKNKKSLSWKGSLLQFCYHLSILTSRIFALGIFASACPGLIFPFCIIHWIVMFQLLRYQTSRSHEIGTRTILQRISESLPTFAYAFVYIFVYFNTDDTPTRKKSWIYYSIYLLENVVMICVSILLPGHKEFFYFALASYALFSIGITLMLIYYRWFHPTLKFTSSLVAIKYLFSDPQLSPLSPMDGITSGRTDTLLSEHDATEMLNGNMNCSKL